MALNFGQALEAMREGKRVCRAGWDGKGMFLYYVPGSTFQPTRPPLSRWYGMGETAEYLPHIDMFTEDGKHVPWPASQTDILSTDWMILVDR